MCYQDSDVVEVSSLTNVRFYYSDSNHPDRNKSHNVYLIKLEDGIEYVCQKVKPLFDKSNPSESSNSDLVESIDDLKNVIYNTFDYHLSRFEDNNKSLDELKSVLNKRLNQIREEL